MRTTLTSDDDGLAVAKDLAARQQRNAGEVISARARQALRPKGAGRKVRNGVPLRPVRTGAAPVTLALVNPRRGELT